MLKLIQATPITLSVAVVAVLAFLVPSSATWLELDTTTHLMGQVPQVLGCHLIHWSLDHLSWDLLMFILVGILCERKNQLSFVAVLTLSAIAIPAFVTACVPAINSYRGLSGIDTALFGYAALLLIEESSREKNWSSVWIYGLLYAGMLGKIGYELMVGGTLFVSDDSFSPVPVAHIVGAVIGTLIATIQFVFPTLQHSSPILHAPKKGTI